ncbi:MAG TPA: transposase [Actinomycetospora sp.]
MPVWSSNRARHRLSRTGNRQLNAAIHRIALTQARCHPEAQAFIARRVENATGDAKRSERSRDVSPMPSTERCEPTSLLTISPSPLDRGARDRVRTAAEYTTVSRYSREAGVRVLPAPWSAVVAEVVHEPMTAVVPVDAV